jgi:hypothetical protein
MDDLRSEIRAAFDREQTPYAPTGALRHDVVAGLHANVSRAPHLNWITVATAMLIAVAIVAGLMATRLIYHPLPAGDYGPPPAGVPLVYVHDPDHPSWLTGYDWTGNPRGTVKLQDPSLGAPWSIDMAPDGQEFYVPGSTSRFLDRFGQPLLSSVGPVDLYTGVWADDNRHFCAMDGQSGSGRLIGPPLQGYALNFVTLPAQVAKTTTIVACSIRNDRAILVSHVDGTTASEVWVARLSGGNMIAHHSYDPRLSLTVVASSDASYVAESSQEGYLGVPSVIRRVSDWRTLASLSASDKVLKFSGDGSLVLVSPTSPAGPLPSSQAHLAIVDWPSGRTTWTYDGTDWPWTVVARPGGRDFALEMGQLPKSGGPCPPANPCVAPEPTRIILIVHDDGSSKRLPSRYYPTW